MNYRFISATAALVLGLALACNFTPTAPFEGFDGMGSRVSGQFASDASGARGLRASAQSTYEGMTVVVEQDPSIQTSVKSNGTFTLEGVPDGTVTLVFRTDGRVSGEITLEDVRPNQEIRIVVQLAVDLRVVLVSEERDQVDFQVGCARSPSFWCKASRGNSSALSQEEFRKLAEEASSMLSGIAELETVEGLADAVCGKGSDRDRFLRELGSLALNLAAGLDRGARLTGEEGEFANMSIGEAFDRAVRAARENPSSGEIDELKDVIEHINDNENTSIPGCVDDNRSEDTKSEDSASQDSPSGSSGSGS